MTGNMVATAVITGLAFALFGTAAGALARRLLCRMRRGTRVRAPLCELAVGAAWAAIGAGWVSGAIAAAWIPALLGLGWLGVTAAVVDLRHRRLPDTLTLPAIPAALVLIVPLGSAPVLRGLAGAVIAVAAYGSLHLVAPRAMGPGDVKLAASLGAVAGASSLAAVALAGALATLFTGVVAVVGMATGRLRSGAALPHGPSMLVAGWLVAVGGAVGSASTGGAG